MFIDELYVEFEKANLILMNTVGVSKHFNADNYDFGALSNHIDYLIFKQSYSRRFGKSYSVADALSDRKLELIQRNINDLIESGVPAEKLVLQHIFESPMTQKANNTIPGHGFKSFNVLCCEYEDTSIWEQSIGDVGSVILRSKTAHMTIVFETTRRIANEVKFGVQRGLAGFMTGDIDMDDIFGLKCCRIAADTFDDFVTNDSVRLNVPFERNVKFPLLNTIHIAINILLNETAYKLALETSKNLTRIPNNSSNCNTSAASTDTFNSCRFGGAMLALLMFLLVRTTF